MKEKSLVSVIIPAYNAARFLPQAIESVLEQTYKNIQVIVVDDGSTDDTERVVRKYPVRYIKIKRSGGPATPRNIGIKNANGKLIAFLDSDDVWLPGKLKEQIDFMNKGKLDFVSSNAQVIDGKGKTIRDSYLGEAKVPSGHVFGPLYQNNFIITSSVLAKKTCLEEAGPFDKGLEGAEDYDLWLRLARLCRFGFLSQKLLRYREHSGSFSDKEVVKSHERLVATLLANYHSAKKVLGGKAKYQLYDLFKFLARTSKGIYPVKYLKYKLLCLVFFSPAQLRSNGISLREEIKGLVKL